MPVTLDQVRAALIHVPTYDIARAWRPGPDGGRLLVYVLEPDPQGLRYKEVPLTVHRSTSTKQFRVMWGALEVDTVDPDPWDLAKQALRDLATVDDIQGAAWVPGRMREVYSQAWGTGWGGPPPRQGHTVPPTPAGGWRPVETWEDVVQSILGPGPAVVLGRSSPYVSGAGGPLEVGDTRVVDLGGGRWEIRVSVRLKGAAATSREQGDQHYEPPTAVDDVS